jgi:hypothetical protein
MEHPEDPYTLEELIEKLEELRNGKEIYINFSKALYTLTFEIKKIHKRLEDLEPWK